MKNKINFSALALGALLAIPTFATPISGTATIVGTVNVSNSTIDFNQTFGVQPAAETLTSNNGAFAGLSGPVAGTIQTLVSPTGQPITGNVFVPQFMTFTNGLSTPVYFDLTYIQPGVGTGSCSSNALGNSCTPTGSPFTIFQAGPSSIAAFLTVDGQGYTGTSSSGSTSYTMGTFTTQIVFSNYNTITGIVDALNNGQTISGISYSAGFTAGAVPEPASLLLVGAGLLGAGLIARRRTARR